MRTWSTAITSMCKTIPAVVLEEEARIDGDVEVQKPRESWRRVRWRLFYLFYRVVVNDGTGRNVYMYLGSLRQVVGQGGRESQAGYGGSIEAGAAGHT